MIKKIIMLICVLGILVCSLTCFSQEQFDDIYIYTTWDDEWFYVAFDVSTPNINGVHNEYNKSIGEDDGVEVLIDTGKERTSKINEDVYSMSISAAGGYLFQKGNKQGSFDTKNIFNHRYGVTLNGSLNNNSDIDNGFSVEMAIPWKELEVEGPNNSHMRINFRVRVNNKDYHLSTKENYLLPTMWNELVLSRIIVVGMSSQNRIYSAKYITEPAINGDIKMGEWNSKTVVNIKIPIIGENPYKINFQEQIIYLNEFRIDSKKNNFLNDYDRLAVLKSKIENEINAGIDVLAIPDDSHVLNIVEAVNEIRIENSGYVLLAPIIEKYKDIDDLYNRIITFYKGVSSQYHYTITDEIGDKSYVIYVKNIEDDKTNIVSDMIEEKYGIVTVFKDISKIEDGRKSREATEYSYILINYDMPSQISSKYLVQSTFFVKNTGTLTWHPGDVALSYRWYKNSRFYSEGFMNIPIMTDVKPGAIYAFSTALLPVTPDGKPIPDGEIIVGIDLVDMKENRKFSEMKNKSSSDTTSKSSLIKANISEIIDYKNPSIITADIPSLISLDSEYKVTMQIQNNTDKPWSNSDTFVGAKLMKVLPDGSEYPHFKTSISKLAFLEDTNPGIVTRAFGVLKFENSLKSKLDPDGVYVIEYTVEHGKTKYPLGQYRVKIGNLDFNQKIIIDTMPNYMLRNEENNPINIIVRNAGSKAWSAKNSFLIGSYYDLKGNVVLENCMKIPLNTDKKVKSIPYGTVILHSVKVDVFPEVNGDYLLLWEIEDNGKKLNNGSIRRSGDIAYGTVTIE